MLLVKDATAVTRSVVVIRVVNRLGGFGMAFLGLRLARDLGLDLPAVGRVLAVFGACTIVSRLLGGVLATRLGARSTIVIGLLASSAAARHRTGSDRGDGRARHRRPRAGLRDHRAGVAGTHRRARPPRPAPSSFALLWASLSVAGVLSGVLAALLSRWGVGALFVADATSSALAAMAALAWLPTSTRAPSDAGGRAATPWRSAVTAPLLRWTGIGTVYATIVMVVVFMLPLSVEATGAGPASTGWLLAVAAAAAIAAQRVVRVLELRLDPALLLVSGHGLLAVGLVLWSTGSLGGLLAGAVLEGASGSLLLGSTRRGPQGWRVPGGRRPS